MRFTVNEVLAGMLASTDHTIFTDDTQRLATMFEDLAGRFPLFAPLANAVDANAVAAALAQLEGKSFLQHADGTYVLTDAGKAHCLSSKRTLFNRGDIEQLNEAAKVFDTL